MMKLGCDHKWTELSMLCVRTINYSALVNGESVGLIIPHRGTMIRVSFIPITVHYLCSRFVQSY